MAEKTLGNTDINGTHKNVPDVVVYGDGDTFAVWVRASSESQGFFKTTKVANVPSGCLVQTETQQRNPDGSYALSQSLAFVPGVWLDKGEDPPRMVTIKEYESIPFDNCEEDNCVDDDDFDDDHKHQKVYNAETFDTFPATRAWICSVCGIEGSEQEAEAETYDNVRRKFSKEQAEK